MGRRGVSSLLLASCSLDLFPLAVRLAAAAVCLLGLTFPGCSEIPKVLGLVDQELTPQPLPGVELINYDFPIVQAPDGSTYSEQDLATLLMQSLEDSGTKRSQVTMKQPGAGLFDITDVYERPPDMSGPLRRGPQTEYHIEEIIRLNITMTPDGTHYVVTADARASKLFEYRYDVYPDGRRIRLDGLGMETTLPPDSLGFVSIYAPKKIALTTKLSTAAQRVKAGHIRWTTKPTSLSKSYDFSGSPDAVRAAIAEAFANSSRADTFAHQSDSFSAEGRLLRFSVRLKSPNTSVLTLSTESKSEWELSFQSKSVECRRCQREAGESVDAAAVKIEHILEKTLRAAQAESASPAPLPRKHVCLVISRGPANLLELPQIKSRVLKKLLSGTVSVQIAVQAQWMKIKIESGETGWVHASLVETAACR